MKTTKGLEDVAAGASAAFKILEEEVPPPNDTAAFIVPRARAARDEGQRLMKRLTELREEMAQVQTRITELRGVVVQYVDDIEACVADANADSDSAPPPTPLRTG